jgi:glycosyltransferase involved in cell wall biosynthesis
MPTQSVVVVPCYNEEQRLNRAIFGAYAGGTTGDVKLLFVDDGSRDGTSGMLRELVSEQPSRLSLLTLPKNAGKAEAVRQGMLAALEMSPDAIGFWDADLATPLEIIDEFRAILATKADVLWVFGSRVKMLGRSIDRRLIRHLAGRGFATAVSLVLDLDVYDTQCGAKLFRADHHLQAVLAEPFGSRWIFDVELLARLAARGRGGLAPPLENCVYEAPLRTWHESRGSKTAAWTLGKPRTRWSR